jgi:hypothetical protein
VLVKILDPIAPPKAMPFAFFPLMDTHIRQQSSQANLLFARKS